MTRRVIIDGVEVDLDKITRENQKNKTDERETLKEYDFTAHSLSLCDVTVEKINIQPHNLDKILVSVSGLQSAVDAIAVKEKNGVVTIGGGSNRQSIRIGNVVMGKKIFNGIQINSGNSVVRNIGSMMVSDGVTIISGGGDVNISTSGTASKLSLDIKVPIGTDIDCDDIDGDVVIGDVEGDLRVDISSTADLQVGKVKEVDLDVSGRNRIDICQVDGDVEIDASGACNIQIRSGKIDKLNVDLSGAGKIDVRCTAQRAKLDVSGMGSVYVEHVVKPPHKDRSGMGSIKVGHIG